MKFEDIISKSFKFPFRDYKRLALIFVLFLLLLILPVGAYFKNEPVFYAGIAAFIAFLLIIPGYFVSVVRQGCVENYSIPQIRPKRNIISTIKLFVLHLVYFLILFLIFAIVMAAIGAFVSPHDLMVMFVKNPLNIFNSLQIVFAITFVVDLIFSIVVTLAEARLANYNSLSKSLNIVAVCRDIRHIGIGRVIGWYFVMAVLIGVINFLAVFLIFIPYVGLIAYLCIAYPIILLIYNYSLGLLYSHVGERSDDDLDIDKFEKELERFKILGR
ncbi:DUF4013 domain-containing protein [Methanobrevibacter sp.]|uniref:DUF4013 domain-containing protein n=1 Tax=Methanobrevibacter sp. TaxID=66852 RepID=UPI003891063B